MAMTELEKEYYDWLVQLVCPTKVKRQKYSKVLKALYDREFYYYILMDENCEGRAVNFRYRFGYEHGISDHIIGKEIDICPARVLEVMVELSCNIEENIMQDDTYGDRTSKWFWDMMDSLGLGKATNDIYDDYITNEIITNFLERDYDENGRGGLFTVRKPFSDMREVPIWAQANWYLNEI